MPRASVIAAVCAIVLVLAGCGHPPAANEGVYESVPRNAPELVDVQIEVKHSSRPAGVDSFIFTFTGGFPDMQFFYTTAQPGLIREHRSHSTYLTIFFTSARIKGDTPDNPQTRHSPTPVASHKNTTLYEYAYAGRVFPGDVEFQAAYASKPPDRTLQTVSATRLPLTQADGLLVYRLRVSF